MLLVILLISFVVRVWYTLQPTIVYWDTAMYIGIGKYIYTAGHLGIWELFRPILFPLVLGGFWKMGLEPIAVGKIIVILASLGTIYYCYRIAEDTKKNAGIFAAILLSFSPLYLAFSNSPLTDIPSTFFTVLALYWFLKKKDFLSGIVVALAFLTRFPQALMLPILGIALLFEYKEFGLKNIFKRGLWLGAGFALLSIPYFISNYILYHNILWPIILGDQVAKASIQYTPLSYFFYIKGFLIQNPFLIFALVGIIAYIKKYKSVLVVTITTLILGAYFSFSSRQELRYGIAFLPFVAILAGFGIEYCAQKFKFILKFKHGTTIISYILMIILSGISLYAYSNYAPNHTPAPEQQAYYSYFNDKGNARILTSSPQFVAYSDVIIADVIDTWEQTAVTYPRLTPDLDYITYNNCEMMCLTTGPLCDAQKKTFIENVDKNEELVYSADLYSCMYRIYKVRH